MVGFWSTLQDVQEDYYALLHNSAFVKLCHRSPNGRVGLSPSAAGALNVYAPSRGGWGSSLVVQLEQLLEEIYLFWSQHREHVGRALAAADGHFIHVDGGRMRRSVARYGPFFDSLLVADQLLLMRDRHFRAPTNSSPALVQRALQDLTRTFYCEDLFRRRPARALAMIVPSSLCFSSDSYARLEWSATELGRRFLSELIGTDLASNAEFVERFRVLAGAEELLNPSLLHLVFSRTNSTNLHDYALDVEAERYGTGIGKASQHHERLLVSDICTRFAEFEIAAADAFAWAQDAEINPWDRELYEWWFRASTAASALALGASFSEDFILKAAASAPDLRFLEHVGDGELYRFLETREVEALREDLASTRCRVRRPNESLGDAVTLAGRHIAERLEDFSEEMTGKNLQIKRAYRGSAFKLTGAAVVSAASAVLPPLGYISLLWGGTVSDLVADIRSGHNHAVEVNQRPIATLVDWRARFSPASGSA